MNMSQVTTSTPTAYPQYFGVHSQTSSHRILTVEGQKLKLNGSAYQLVPNAQGAGKPKFKRRILSTTQGYVPNPSIDVSFIAICAKTNQRIRLIGQLVPPKTKTVDDNAFSSKKIEANEVVKSTLTVSENFPSPKTKLSALIANSSEYLMPVEALASINNQACQQRKLVRFQRELEIITAQQQAGLNPPVSITAAGYMSNRSHASIYRDIKKAVLPQPTKIGRNSTLPYSVVKAYTAGQLVGVSA